MASAKLRVIVTGLIAQYPLGGVAWDYLQFIIGLQQLGHDVYYFEDSGQWPYYPVEGGIVKEDCTFNVEYLANLMGRFGLQRKWAYCFPWQTQWFGLEETERVNAINTADLLVNISGCLDQPGAYRQIPRLVYIDSDPMFTQIKLVQGPANFRDQVNAHDIHFSYGECLSTAVPKTGHHWIPTRQPIVLSEWNSGMPHRNVFTTVMNWTSYNDVTYQGNTYGQKDVEFLRFLHLPRMVSPTILEIAANVGKTRHTPYEQILDNGWKIVNPSEVCPDLDSYRRYIESSKGEWSIAKNAYVAGKTGWFSCRSACYLAAGKPVILQDTGFSSVLPTGKGLMPFTTIEEAVEAFHKVEDNYDLHSKVAREVAEEYFNSDRVLVDLIENAFARKGETVCSEALMKDNSASPEV
jgi:hypothetical protein